MARMRTIKPEFWDDDVVAQLSRDARLLFMATWNAADDEGLLRWNAAYLKASAFMYDDDLGALEVEKLMAELVDADLIFPYQGGKSLQRLAVIIKFHRHQKINRPQPSKLPPPSLQNPAVAQMYARRDAWTCHICNGPIEWTVKATYKQLSLDHVHPQSKGGTDFPSNIKIAHRGCNSAKGAKLPDYSPTDSVNPPGTVTDGIGSGLGEGNGEVEEGNGWGRGIARRGTRLTDDWTPSDSAKSWTLERIDTQTAAVELEKFRNHWHAKAGGGAVKVDWDATWRNWVLNAQSFNASRGRASPSRGSTADQRVQDGLTLASELRREEAATRKELPA